MSNFDSRYSRFFDSTLARLIEENKLLEAQKQLIETEEKIFAGFDKKLQQLEKKEQQIIAAEEENNQAINDLKNGKVPSNNKTYINIRNQLAVDEDKKRKVLYENWKRDMIKNISKNNDKLKR
jgi:hypothetical protein